MYSPLKRSIQAAQYLSLCGMAWFVWVNRVDPKLSHESLRGVLFEAIGWVILTWVGSVLITAGAAFAAAAHQPGKERSLLTAALPGVWFAPAIILIGTLSPTGLAIGFLLVVGATRSLLTYWIPADIESRQALKIYAFEINTVFLNWNSVPALVIAAAGEAGLVALLLRYPFLAAVGIAASIAVLIGHLIAKGAYAPGTPPAMPPSAMGMVLTFLLALALTTSSIQVGIMSASGNGTADKTSGATSRVTFLHEPPQFMTGGGDGFEGVILKPQQQEDPATVLLLPAPWAKRAISQKLPVSIPFSGEYWMFQAPWHHPPPWSVLEHGKPTEVSFHTTNGRPMQMTADQKLDGPVELAGCAKIQVLISRTGDEAVRLELILTDSDSGRSESLGTAEATGNILDYSIPAAGPLEKFDEINLVYHRLAIASRKSARIAIERFVIVQRG
jgi:hypothetical protein